VRPNMSEPPRSAKQSGASPLTMRTAPGWCATEIGGGIGLFIEPHRRNCQKQDGSWIAMRQSKTKQKKPPKKDGKAARTRLKLLDAGVKMFAKFGYFGASTRQIEAVAKVQRNLITYHFGGKDEFWKACMEHLFRQFIGTTLSEIMIIPFEQPDQRLRELIVRYLRASAEHPEIHQIFVEEGKRDDWRMQWLVDKYAKQFYSVVVDLYEQARNLGIAPDIGPVGFFYVLTGGSAVFSLAPECRQLTGKDPMSDDMIEEHAANIAKLLIREVPSKGN